MLVEGLLVVLANLELNIKNLESQMNSDYKDAPTESAMSRANCDLNITLHDISKVVYYQEREGVRRVFDEVLQQYAPGLKFDEIALHVAEDCAEALILMRREFMIIR